MYDELSFETLKKMKFRNWESMKHIQRVDYLRRLEGLVGTPDIKIITGIRRSGKSQLLKDFMDLLRSSDNKRNIISIDLLDLDNEELKDYRKLHSFIKDHLKEKEDNFLFIDEVQMCPKFELAVNSIHAKGNVDIYLTGSNAFLLSSDLATLFTGRFLEIKVFPFSFKEYLEYWDFSGNRDQMLDSYMLKGGLAGSFAYENEVDRVSYIRDVFETIVTRDLVQKYEIKDTDVLMHLAQYLMDNISNLSSPNRIGNILRETIPTANHVTIGRYCDYLCRAFVFYDIARYDIRGSKYLETLSKLYLADTGIRYAMLGTRNIDFGRAYENIVCIELLRRGYEIYVGMLYQKEVDFVAMRGDEKMYIQVSDDISSETTLERELEPLRRIKDNYPKFVIAKTGHPAYSIEGIRILNLADWLCDSETVVPKL